MKNTNAYATLERRIAHVANRLNARETAGSDWESLSVHGIQEDGDADGQRAVHSIIRSFFTSRNINEGMMRLSLLIKEKTTQLAILEAALDAIVGRNHIATKLYPNGEPPVNGSLAYAKGFHRGELRTLENWYEWMMTHYARDIENGWDVSEEDILHN